MQHNIMKTFNFVEVILWSIVLLLLITGGYRTHQFEIAQIDVFAVLLLMIGIRSYRHTSNFVSEPVKTIFNKIKIQFEKKPFQWVFSFFVLYTLIYSITLIQGHRSFNINAYDIGYIDQPIWSTAYEKGEIFLKSNLSRGLGSYLSEHFSPILALIAPLYRVYDSIYVLYFLQSFLLALGALVLYLLCVEYKVSNFGKVILPICFLLFQPLKTANLFSFREDVFFVPLLFLLILFLEKKYWVKFWLTVLLVFAIKENAPIVLFLIGAWLLIKKERLHGLALITISGAFFYILNSKITPYFSNGASQTLLVSRLSFLGSNFNEIFNNIFFHPFYSLGKFFVVKIEKRTFFYLLTLLLPFIFFWRWKPLKEYFSVYIALILILVNLLMTEHIIGFHYECILIPFLFAGFAKSYASSEKKLGALNLAAFAIILTLCVYGRSPILTLREWLPNPQHTCLEEGLKAIPQTASISTQSGLHPHIDHRKIAKDFSKIENANEDLIVLSAWSKISNYPNVSFSQELKKLSMEQTEKYKPLFESKLLSIFCKSGTCGYYQELGTELQKIKCLN